MYRDLPVDAAGTSAVRSVELTLGIKLSGGACLLLDKVAFETYVIPQAGISRRSNKLPPLYRTSDFRSLSPIRFTSTSELEEIFRAMRPKRAGINGEDDSKLNKNPKAGWTEFEQARLLQYSYLGSRPSQLMFTTYGLPPLSAHLRMAYLAFTPWIDPNSYDILPNEEELVLDIGWYEPSRSIVRHLIVEEYERMSKTVLPKSAFEHGESKTLTESSLGSTLTSLLAPSSEGPTGPLVLVTHDWPRTARLLNSHGIDTTGHNWHVSLYELLGFKRPNAVKENQNQSGSGRENSAAHGESRRRPADNGYEDRRQASVSGKPGYRNLGDPNFDVKPKIEPKEETKQYEGGWGSSSPTRKRSQSPRSRQRPLSDTTERKYQRPVFLPDDNEDHDKEEGECSSPHRPTTPEPSVPLPQIHVIDIRSLLSTALNAPRPREYITYPPCARRLGFPVDGWCAGNQAVQMHKVLGSLVGGEPINRRESQLKAQPGLSPPAPPPGSDTSALLEGIAGRPQLDNIQTGLQSFADEWNDTADDDDDW
ncbi:hypothetical protein FRC07_012695 [Ceratobasidium sp. 392]|nr:hypothetical protein FRC07_012695 [Ceratobasidium sp. 392]